MALRGLGINYDTGFFPGGKISRQHFDRDIVRHELHVIRHDLHCAAVRISGGDPERLSAAAELAAAEGLEVWFAPFPCELTTDELRPFFVDCADRAEAVRTVATAPVVLVLGCELSLFGAGFLPGNTVFQRIDGLMRGSAGSVRSAAGQLDEFFADVVTQARTRFHGPITYASGTWEFIDWTPFDIVAIDAYRDANTAGTYAQELRAQVERTDKPVVVTEFGCCTYVGAADRGGIGWDIVDDTSTSPARIPGDYQRDESEQVRYLHECLNVFDEVGVDSAFWFTFASFDALHREDPHQDLDLASYGVVKMIGESAWQPKESFSALAEAYRRRG
ncbi:hypothetical protein GCM10023322_19740 [Rugosimonospora acidiphila]|uniref:Abortive infection protein n=1 Tax=Rugosimonospora acidiphila TaxID=556531 RepID=A0ABP9RPM2_9ACTN